MESNGFYLSSISIEDLRSIIRESVQDCFSKLETKSQIQDEELLSRKEVAKIYKTSLVTLRQWEKNGVIPKPIRKASRVYFRRSEILKDISSNPQSKRK